MKRHSKIRNKKASQIPNRKFVPMSNEFATMKFSKSNKSNHVQTNDRNAVRDLLDGFQVILEPNTEAKL